MTYILAGSFSGLVMASVSTTVGALVLFSLTKNPPLWFTIVASRVSPMRITMGLVIFLYPAWMVLGAILGILYAFSTEVSSVSGAGSPNLPFTLLVVVSAILIVTPAVLLLKRVATGLTVLTLCFIGVFGWLLPHITGQGH